MKEARKVAYYGTATSPKDAHLIGIQQGIGSLVFVQQVVCVVRGAGHAETGPLVGRHALECIREALAPLAAGGPLGLGGGHVDQGLVHRSRPNGLHWDRALQPENSIPWRCGSLLSWPYHTAHTTSPADWLMMQLGIFPTRICDADGKVP